MQRNLFVFFLSLIPFVQSAYSQKHSPFEGRFTYEVIYLDSVSNQAPTTSFMTVYTNDTLVRIETETTQLGKQILIKHLTLKKYYILLEINGQKFAIQHYEEKDTLNKPRYTFKPKFGHKKFAGMKAKKTIVSSVSTKKSQTVYYLKNINPGYTEAIKGIKGLPVEYFIQTEEGVFKYKLIEFLPQKISIDQFGVPSDYQKVSFDEFMEKMMNAN